MLSIIVPAHNEEEELAPTLKALLASNPVVEPDGTPVPVEIIVVANGCSDRTAQVALSFDAPFREAGSRLTVVELDKGSKTGALRCGETIAQGEVTVYLDADIEVSPPLLAETWLKLARKPAGWASGKSTIVAPRSSFTDAYRRFYNEVPFRKDTIPGGGYFAVNRKGRARWGSFPDVVADDLFVRLNFEAKERVQLQSAFYWRLAEGMPALVRARSRQDRGTRELQERHPMLFMSEDKPNLSNGDLVKMAAKDITAFCAYASVRVAARFLPDNAAGWRRGR